jgi:starvation-inducible DNA-binding protein
MTMPYINDQLSRAETAESLGKLLSDTYVIYLKTQGFHWNVVGPQFEPLHTMFETQYTELALAIDDIAERIRTLGAKAPGSLSELAGLASISEETGAPAAEAMVAQLVSDHITASRIALQIVRAADSQGDVATADIATQRVAVHEKTAWMMSSMLQHIK